MLVDDSIVVLENIHRISGKARTRSAAITDGDWPAAIAITPGRCGLPISLVGVWWEGFSEFDDHRG
jgi:hypothetical protein